LEIAHNQESDRYVSNLIAVIMHEMLHALILRHRIINRGKDRGEYFEEAVLDYFVPHGMLAQKLKIIEKGSVKDYYEYNLKNRKYAEKVSKELLPAMEEYEKLNAKSDIWTFLKAKGFGKYF